jgi:hypothetical protein
MHHYNSNWDGIVRKTLTNLEEAPVLAPDTAGSMFGYSKPQFEMKIRQLIQKMGFEKGITRMMNKPNGNMVIYFANKAKARDFAITFQGMIRSLSKGKTIAQFVTLADMDTDEKKYAMGAEALVELMFNLMKTEEVNEAFENLLSEEVSEEVQGLQENMMKHFTDLGDFAKNVNHNAILLRKKDRLKTSDVQDYLFQIAGSLNIAHGQQQDFLQGLIFHLEGIHRKVMSPSKHGNMEIMKDLEFMIRELKTYKK